MAVSNPRLKHVGLSLKANLTAKVEAISLLLTSLSANYVRREYIGTGGCNT